MQGAGLKGLLAAWNDPLLCSRRTGTSTCAVRADGDPSRYYSGAVSHLGLWDTVLAREQARHACTPLSAYNRRRPTLGYPVLWALACSGSICLSQKGQNPHCPGRCQKLSGTPRSRLMLVCCGAFQVIDMYRTILLATLTDFKLQGGLRGAPAPAPASAAPRMSTAARRRRRLSRRRASAVADGRARRRCACRHALCCHDIPGTGSPGSALPPARGLPRLPQRATQLAHHDTLM